MADETKTMGEIERNFDSCDNSSNENDDAVSLELSCSSSAFEDDESDERNSPVDNTYGVAPYQFEPYDSDVSNDGNGEPDNRTRNSTPEPSERLGNTDWCQCGHCSVMASEVECVCCKEISRVAGNIDESEEIINCITEHSGFNPVCLNTYVLETAYYQYKQQYRVALENCPERNRYAAYRQFVRWNWGYLGKKIRVVIPSCAIKQIREKFPAENNVYTGFNPPE